MSDLNPEKLVVALICAGLLIAFLGFIANRMAKEDDRHLSDKEKTKRLMNVFLVLAAIVGICGEWIYDYLIS